MSFRKFNGVKFRLSMKSAKKSNINTNKASAKKQGNKVRVIELSDGRYALYERSKKGWEDRRK